MEKYPSKKYIPSSNKYYLYGEKTMSELDNQIAVVFGVGTGMGRSIAYSLHERGAKIILVSRNTERLEKICKELGEGCYALKGDVTNIKEIQDIRNKILNEIGKPSIIVYNAGGYFTLHTIEHIDQEFFNKALELNSNGFFHVTKMFLLDLQDTQGTIIAITAAPKTLLLGNIAYAASKGALTAMVKKLACELKEYNIRVNCVAPGPTSHEPSSKKDLQIKLTSTEPSPSKDVGEIVAFLASKQAPRITGECINLDSGASLPCS